MFLFSPVERGGCLWTILRGPLNFFISVKYRLHRQRTKAKGKQMASLRWFIRILRRKKPIPNKEVEPLIEERGIPMPTNQRAPFRSIQTSRRFPNMPKSQRCFSCEARAKRKEKTPAGAVYICSCKNAWLVPYPKGAYR